jgi:tetratricopeptide (TPR) repeat protein
VFLQPAVHRTIVVVDVEGFNDQRRTDPHQLMVRAGMYDVLKWAFRDAGISWDDCYHEDRGDGVLVLGPTLVSKSVFVESLPLSLVKELRRHNAAHPVQAQMRLRMALHAGEVIRDDHGAAGTALNLTFRLSDAPPLKTALAKSPGLLALITSSWFFDEVVRHSPGSQPSSYWQVNVEVKETATIGWICLPDHPYPTSDTPSLVVERASAVPHQLPAYTPHFVGRASELGQLTAHVDAVHQTAVIVAINGPAGVGKTALAVHWAQQVQAQFPDGQLYVDLRGFHATGQPAQPATAIRGFLCAFGIPPERIPAGLDAQAALYRSVLANQRVLVVLDNARDVDQVRPLLPGSPTCVVVITSRDQLVRLITWEGARPVNLGALDLAEATALLSRRIGQHRIDAEPEAVVDLLDRCARLPLAVAVVAARIELNPGLSIRILADELADESTRLDMLDDLRAVFAWSYHYLEPPAARMFRLLSLHPGPDASVTAAASLAGVSIDQARTMLAELTQAHLFTEVAPGRFGFHDLLRSYALAQTTAVDSEAARHATVHRLLDHYLHTSFAAALTSIPQQDVGIDGVPQAGVVIDIIQTGQHAKSWFVTEYHNLLLLVEYSHQLGFDAHCWKLAWAFSAHLEWQGHWQDLLAIKRSILAAVDRLHDGHARRRIQLMLGWMYGRTGQVEKAQEHGTQSLQLSRTVGDGFGEAASHFILAMACSLQQEESEGFNHAKQALDFFHTTKDYRWQARAHRLYAWIHGQCENHSEAAGHCRQALRLLQQVNGSHDEAATVENFLAWTQYHLGNYEEAILYYEKAIAKYQELADHYNEAKILLRLGDTYHASDNPTSSRTSWQRAVNILAHLNLPHADQIQIKLNKRLNAMVPDESVDT